MNYNNSVINYTIMRNEYKDKEKRKKYLREYRIKNREKIYKQHAEWRQNNNYYKTYYKNNKDKYRSKYKNKEELLGTSGLGRKYEKIALEILKGSIDCNKDNFSGKWDIEWNGFKIDVKMRNYSEKYGWHFTTKKNSIADYYLCFCVKNDVIDSIYLFPKEIFKNCITIKENTKKHNSFILNIN